MLQVIRQMVTQASLPTPDASFEQHSQRLRFRVIVEETSLFEHPGSLRSQAENLSPVPLSPKKDAGFPQISNASLWGKGGRVRFLENKFKVIADYSSTYACCFLGVENSNLKKKKLSSPNFL
jgi:hypothetical protein